MKRRDKEGWKEIRKQRISRTKGGNKGGRGRNEDIKEYSI